MENDPKKKRVALACNNCRLKKYKCNGIQPVCNSCAKQSLDCAWTPKSTAPAAEKMKGPRARYIASLKEKIKTLEELARNLNLNIYQQKPSAGLTCLEDELGDCYGDEQSPSAPHDSPVSQHGTPSLTTHSLMTDIESIEYPHDAVEELPMLYFACFYNTEPAWYLNRATFISSLSTISPILLNSIYAIASRFSTHPFILTADSDPYQKFKLGEVFYAKARRLVMDNMDKMDESPHLDFVHGLFSLATYSISSGRGSAGWMYVSMAIRISILMNLNIDPDFLPLKLSWIEKEQRRRTWWTCYATDKMMSIYCNRPQSITAPSNVKPPLSGRVWEYIRRDTGSPNPPPNVVDTTSDNAFRDPIFACVKLLGILHKIWEASAFFKTATEDLNQIQGPIFEAFQKYKQQILGLQTELTDWFNALPAWISNPGIIFFPEIQSENPPSYHVAYTHIMYHTARVILHRPLMMKVAKLCPRATRSSFHWQQCTDAANQVSSLLSVMLSDNPCLHHCNPFIMFCIYQTSLVHILNTQLAQCIKEEDGPEMVWPEHVLDMGAVPKFACNIEKDETINIWWEKSVMSLMVHIQAMKGMAILWYPARKYLCIWKKLVVLAKLEKWVPVTFPGEIEITEKEMEDQVVENDTAVLPNGFEPEAVEIKRREAEFQSKLLQQHQDQWKLLSSAPATEPVHTHSYALPGTVVPVVSSVYEAMSRPNYFDINFNQVSDFANNQNYMLAMEHLGLNGTTSFISPNMYEKLQPNPFTNVPMSTSSLVTPTATPTPFTIHQPELRLWEQFQEVSSNLTSPKCEIMIDHDKMTRKTEISKLWTDLCTEFYTNTNPTAQIFISLIEFSNHENNKIVSVPIHRISILGDPLYLPPENRQTLYKYLEEFGVHVTTGLVDAGNDIPEFSALQRLGREVRARCHRVREVQRREALSVVLRKDYVALREQFLSEVGNLGGLGRYREIEARAKKLREFVKHSSELYKGTVPFLKGLHQFIYRQANEPYSSRRGIMWNLEDAVFTQTAPEEWTEESIYTLSVILEFSVSYESVDTVTVKYNCRFKRHEFLRLLEASWIKECADRSPSMTGVLSVIENQFPSETEPRDGLFVEVMDFLYGIISKIRLTIMRALRWNWT